MAQEEAKSLRILDFHIQENPVHEPPGNIYQEAFCRLFDIY